MSAACTHPKTGVVTSDPTGIREKGAQSPVCPSPACITDAEAWVRRVSRKPAFHVPDVQKAEVTA